jgi:ATP-dependent DNA helicase PIF1
VSLGTINDNVELSPSQRKAVELCIDAARSGEGRFINIEGKAGTGKSTVLRHLRKHLRLLVCAPTGLAAVNVRGETVHRLFGFKIGPKTKGNVRGASDQKADVIHHCDAIAIDEKSMVRADLMDAINYCLQKTLDDPRPFGGKTIIAFGDMFQLEPVVGDNEKDWLQKMYPSPFWFDAQVFGSAQMTLDGEAQVEIETVELLDVFRQQGDPDFIDSLNKVRIGDPSGLALINQRAHCYPDPDDLPVSITFTNKKADSINAQRLAEVDAEPVVFNAQIEGEFSEDPAPRELTLKVGAQVMVTKNIMSFTGELIANGTVGEIVGLFNGAPVLMLRDGTTTVIERARWDKIAYALDDQDDLSEEVEGSFTQYPLKLAWAVTAHKSQGQTLDAAYLELDGRAFAHGQVYVALSRTRSMGGLYLKRRLTKDDLTIHKRVREFFASTRKTNASAFGRAA